MPHDDKWPEDNPDGGEVIDLTIHLINQFLGDSLENLPTVRMAIAMFMPMWVELGFTDEMYVLCNELRTKVLAQPVGPKRSRDLDLLDTLQKIILGDTA